MRVDALRRVLPLAAPGGCCRRGFSMLPASGTTRPATRPELPHFPSYPIRLPVEIWLVAQRRVTLRRPFLDSFHRLTSHCASTL